jgi:hypothetical protein
MQTNQPKDYRITVAVDKDTFNAVHGLAFRTYRTASSIGHTAILHYMENEEEVLESTSREFKVKILTEKSTELSRILRKTDEFYEFKVNFWEICLNLSGRMSKNNSHSTETHGFKDFITVLESIRTTEPTLYAECCFIMRKTLNKAQRELVLPSM